MMESQKEFGKCGGNNQPGGYPCRPGGERTEPSWYAPNSKEFYFHKQFFKQFTWTTLFRKNIGNDLLS